MAPKVSTSLCSRFFFTNGVVTSSVIISLAYGHHLGLQGAILMGPRLWILSVAVLINLAASFTTFLI